VKNPIKKYVRFLKSALSKTANPAAMESTSPLQIYSGYTEEDIALLRSFVVQEARLEESFYVDGFSHKTLYSSVSFCNQFDLARLTVPVPDDGFHAETLEYVAVCDSVYRATSKYSIVEIGAGWGPWISLGGVLARNKGINNIHLIGVEAHPDRFELMRNQLIVNQLRQSTKLNVTDLNGIHCKLLQGAASSETKILWFPKVSVLDMGAAASREDHSDDYRGMNVQNFPVPGFTLEEIIGDLEVDMLHVDIQGTEFELLESGIDLINDRIKAMMIATHSRVIEGQLIELLYRNGWYLHREKPCIVGWRTSPASIEAMTQVDGCQYWRR
jgi:FkbM family methyltransferase